jgi:hypothetical protein
VAGPVCDLEPKTLCDEAEEDNRSKLGNLVFDPKGPTLEPKTDVICNRGEL